MAAPAQEASGETHSPPTVISFQHPTYDAPRTTPLHLCSIASWYPLFAEHTFRTEIIPVPAAIADWLVEDGIVLPDVDSAFPTRMRDRYDSSDEYSSDDENRLHEREDEIIASIRSTPSTSPRSDADAAEARPPSPPASAASMPELLELYASITSAIERLGGAVIPKMQWSCPKDACWMLPNNTLKCTDANDVCLLLKSSDRIAHDVETMRELLSGERQECPGSPKSTVEMSDSTARASASLCAPPSHVVALRTYYDLKPGREFRCFVKNGSLVAICQRDREYHRHLVDNVDEYREKIVHFHNTCVRPRLLLPDVAFDCYVPEGSSRLRLIDLNVFGEETSTHPLLFTWDEVRAFAADAADASDEANDAPGPSRSGQVPMRIIADEASRNAIRPSETSLYGVPYDFVHEGATEQLREFLEKQTL